MELQTPRITEMFHLTAGSVCGREHRRVGKNNQDAFKIYTRENATAVILCDGCGSTPHSEFGARWISSFLSQQLVNLDSHLDIDTQLNAALDKMTTRMKQVAKDLDHDANRAIWEHFLATVIGAVINENSVTLFYCGDGSFIVNGEVTTIDSPGNAPDYPAYRILSENGPGFTILKTIPTEEIKSLVLATDGMRYLAETDIDADFNSWVHQSIFTTTVAKCQSKAPSQRRSEPPYAS